MPVVYHYWLAALDQKNIVLAEAIFHEMSSLMSTVNAAIVGYAL